MPYKRKSTPKVVTTAKARISGMRSIDPKLNLGDGMTIEAYEAEALDLEEKVNAYNIALANIGELQRQIQDSEKQLADRSERMLSLVAGRYGKRSNEYEKAGGKKRIPKTSSNPKATTPNPSPLKPDASLPKTA